MSYLGGPLPGFERTEEEQQASIDRAVKLVKDVGQALVPDIRKPEEVAQHFTELGSDIWRSKNLYKGVGMFVGKKVISQSPEIRKAVSLAQEFVDPVVQKTKKFLETDYLEPVYESIGVQPRGRVTPDTLPSTAQPLQAVSGINPQRTLRGSEYIEGLKTVIKSDPPIKDVQGFVKTGAKELIENKPQRIERYLNRGLSKNLKSKYKNSQSGYWNAKKLSNDPKLLNKVIDRHDEVTDLFNKYKNSPTSGNQRELYDKIGESYFDDSALIYGGHALGKKARKRLVEASQWFSKDHWHHIFGNKEIGEFMLTEVAQDPLIGVNLFKHMKKRGLSVSGVADNILIMKEKGHKNFHEFLRAIGIEGKFGRTAVGGFEDYGQEISKVVQGRAQAAKTFTTETGEVIQKGTRYPADPEAVNELFTMIDAYAEQNKWIRQKFKEGAITVMEPTGSKGLRKVVPNGYKAKKGESVFVYDLTANKGGKPRLPEVYSDKAGRIKKVLDET